MTSIDLRKLLAPEMEFAAFERIRRRLPAAAPEDWRALAALGAMALRSRRVVGIGGGQGAGKSTLAALLAQAMSREGHSAIACSLDDFYLTRQERRRLAATRHPLLATRGVPGTHDCELARRTIESLVSGAPTRVPHFDKGRDDRAPQSDWREVRDIQTVVFEGWCLGVTPQPEKSLEVPVNTLEANEDADGAWRTQVNNACGLYSPLWRMVDWWIFLEVPDMGCVRRWRAEQERANPAAERLSGPELTRFIAHYERLTLWLKSSFPSKADWHLILDVNHRVAGAHAR